MDDKGMKDLENTLQISKFAHKPPKDELSIDNVLEDIKASHQKLGQDIDLLQKRIQDSINTILDLSRIMSK